MHYVSFREEWNGEASLVYHLLTFPGCDTWGSQELVEGFFRLFPSIQPILGIHRCLYRW